MIDSKILARSCTHMELKRWTKNDPEDLRCDFTLDNGYRCGNLAEETINRCALHGANKILAAKENQSLRMYRLAQWQTRVNQLADHDKIKSLRDEIAILRMLVENRIAHCSDSQDLLLQSGPLSDLLMKVEKVVSSCNRLESKLGDVLDAQRVRNLASAFMQMIAKRVTEFSVVNNLDSSSLIEAISNDFLDYLKENK